jgi:hypothetical protein
MMKIVVYTEKEGNRIYLKLKLRFQGRDDGPDSIGIGA